MVHNVISFLWGRLTTCITLVSHVLTFCMIPNVCVCLKLAINSFNPSQMIFLSLLETLGSKNVFCLQCNGIMFTHFFFFSNCQLQVWIMANMYSKYRANINSARIWYSTLCCCSNLPKLCRALTSVYNFGCLCVWENPKSCRTTKNTECSCPTDNHKSVVKTHLCMCIDHSKYGHWTTKNLDGEPEIVTRFTMGHLFSLHSHTGSDPHRADCQNSVRCSWFLSRYCSFCVIIKVCIFDTCMILSKKFHLPLGWIINPWHYGKHIGIRPSMPPSHTNLQVFSIQKLKTILLVALF